MVLQTWSDVLTQSFQNLWIGVLGFVPNLVVALIIFIIGWVIAAVLGRVVAQIIKALRVDSALASAGFEDVINRTGFNLNSGLFIGDLVKWFIIIVFLVAAFDVLGLAQVTIFLKDVVLLYLPNVFVAALILLSAALIAQFIQRVVTGSAKAAGIPSAHFLGGVARWAIWIFALLAAVSQLGIAGVFAQTLFTGVIVALSLGIGLAFGLGGKDAAAKYIERLRGEISGK
ncbi:MAG: hypothetical protein COW88_01770 [Candidatus Lloydbacteria bacterium CG22_combo_CG10-13_8_21_14_all_47_15]|uniref:Small-conductance mechanosensitive ion channel n=1 Tax=Candidatus Lloydbacteria bacterium CG22_combo_CG10-13_8_21_14_all_47_15 TaxID=1974635 RepID=A0A2H0CU99_9BACT|nr:MAG: hypothetical protein COW88_01770 [Candidatus Lloydbacteria bacterium CG22_combo_CG10-13_8_21_14_all_47_15]